MNRRVWAFCLAMAAGRAAAQWTLQNSGVTADFRGIDYVGNGVAWASGSHGTVLRTVDMGKTWTRCATPPDGGELDFRGVQAFDATTAIVMSSGKGELSRLYKTVDGCKTWRLVFTNPDREGFWDALQFKRRDLGVLLGDPVGDRFALFLSFDQGQSWTPDTMPVRPLPAGEAAFAASNSSMVIGSRPGERTFCTGGVGGSRVVHHNTGIEDTIGPHVSHDRRTGWATTLWFESLDVPATGSTKGCFSIANNEAVWVGVGGDYTTPEASAFTAWTSKLLPRSPGFKLRNASTPPHGYRSAVAFDSASKTWITVGPNGTDVSTDDGKNWRALRPGAGEEPEADQHWNALSLPFVVGPKGRIGVLREGVLRGNADSSAALRNDKQESLRNDKRESLRNAEGR